MKTPETRDMPPLDLALTAAKMLFPKEFFLKDQIRQLGYLDCGWFEDSNGNSAEVRLIQDKTDKSSFTLNANVGDGLALIELKERFEKQGVRIDRLVSYFGMQDPIIRGQLEAHSRKK